MPSVSDIKIWPVNGNRVILANGSFLLEKAVQVKFSVIKGPKGPFVGFPGKTVEKDGKKTFYADVSVVDKAFSNELTSAVMKAYNDKTGNKFSQGDSPEPTSQTADDEVPF
jgi:DNA-binding cell septation regulator SpoVG